MNSLHTRRTFLRSTALGGALSWTVPSFLAGTFDRLHAEAADQPTQAVTGKDAPILVVLQMAGGNDGLNTVVPFTDDDYHRARPRLGLKPDAVLKLDDTTGLHPALKGLKSLHDDGLLGVIQAVGYPNPNRSHFRSTDIWMTASDSDRFENLGWLGRYFDNACAGADPIVGISVGRQSPLAFAARQPTGVAVESNGGSRSRARREDMTGMADMADEPGDDPAMLTDSGGAGGSIDTVSGSKDRTSPLDFLERTTLDARVSSEQIRAVTAQARNSASYPASRLANDLKLVAQLIAGGMPTRVYYVSQGGYDTHTNQAPAHQRLLGELGDTLQAFITDLRALGQLDRVLVMTFSEFGRRVAENASGGTDHGAAAPLFLLGRRIKPGLLGASPSLAPRDLLKGDVRFQTDFRAVYASVLEQWLQTASSPVLGRTFAPVRLLA